MYRLFPCIPIFRVFLFFYIKSAKRMCICDYVKNRIGTCSNLRFGGKKGYKQIITLDSPKTYCFRDTLSWNTMHIMAAISYFPVCGSFRRAVLYFYMIRVCWDEISTRPAGTDFTLRVHVEIKFCPGKAGQFSNGHFFRFECIVVEFVSMSVYKMEIL